MHAAKYLLVFMCFVAVASGIKTIARDQGDLSLQSDTGVVDKDQGGASLQPVGDGRVIASSGGNARFEAVVGGHRMTASSGIKARSEAVVVGKCFYTSIQSSWTLWDSNYKPSGKSSSGRRRYGDKSTGMFYVEQNFRFVLTPDGKIDEPCDAGKCFYYSVQSSWELYDSNYKSSGRRRYHDKLTGMFYVEQKNFSKGYLLTTNGKIDVPCDDNEEGIQAVASLKTGAQCGTSWTPQIDAGFGVWQAVAYGGGQFVAVSLWYKDDNVMTSPDGVTWSLQKHVGSFQAIVYAEEKELFVAVSQQWIGAKTSKDGISWSQPPNVPGGMWNSVAYGNSVFVAVAQVGHKCTKFAVMTSPDGVTWTQRASASCQEWTSVVFGGGKFVAVANAGLSNPNNRVMTSEDGISWISGRAPVEKWESVTYGKNKFVAVGHAVTGGRVMTSEDGVTWTSQKAPVIVSGDQVAPWDTVGYGGGLFVALAAGGNGECGKDCVMTSPDGISWTMQKGAAMNSVAFGDGKFVAVGHKNKDKARAVLTSTCEAEKAAKAGSAAAMVQKQIKEAAKANAGACDPMQHTSESTTAIVPKAGGEPVIVLADAATKSRQHIFFRAKSQGIDFEISLRENGNSFFTYNLAGKVKNADVSNCRMVDKVSNEAGTKATTALMTSEWSKVPSKFYWRGFRVIACTDSCSLNPLDTLAKEMTADKSKTVFSASPKLKEFIEKEMTAHPMTTDTGDEWVYIQSFSTDAKLSLALRPFTSTKDFKVDFSYFLKHKCSS